MAQGEILDLVQVFVIYWKMLGKNMNNTFGEGLGKNTAYILGSVNFMYQCVFVRKG